MKYKFLIILFIITSCTSNSVQKANIELYRSSGFALIYDENDYVNKIISRRLNSNEMEIGHNKIKKNSIIRLTNPENNKSLQLKNTKKIDYPGFFNIVITKKIADKLSLDTNMPFVEIEEKIKNQSFVAKKAVTFEEEQQVSNTAPVTEVNIKNISINKNIKSKKNKKFSIIIGEFYSKKSAQDLVKTLENNYVKKGSLKVKKLSKNKFELLSGPYSSIITLKERYFELNKYGFEDLDIKQNE